MGSSMKIAGKGQVTIPQTVWEKAGLHRHSEVEFEMRDNGEVVFAPRCPLLPGYVRPLPGYAVRPMQRSSRA